MEQVGSYEAKTRLAELLDKVAKGESILITRHGKAAAVLGPAPGTRSRSIDQTIAELNAFAAKHTLDVDLRRAIEAGRR